MNKPTELRVGDLVEVFHAALSDRCGNIVRAEAWRSGGVIIKRTANLLNPIGHFSVYWPDGTTTRHWGSWMKKMEAAP